MNTCRANANPNMHNDSKVLFLLEELRKADYRAIYQQAPTQVSNLPHFLAFTYPMILIAMAGICIRAQCASMTGSAELISLLPFTTSRLITHQLP